MGPWGGGRYSAHARIGRKASGSSWHGKVEAVEAVEEEEAVEVEVEEEEVVEEARGAEAGLFLWQAGRVARWRAGGGHGK